VYKYVSNNSKYKKIHTQYFKALLKTPCVQVLKNYKQHVMNN